MWRGSVQLAWCLFGTISGLWLYLNVRAGILPSFGDDQYIAAVRRWLSGVDPWATEYPGWFAAKWAANLPEELLSSEPNSIVSTPVFDGARENELQGLLGSTLPNRDGDVSSTPTARPCCTTAAAANRSRTR